MLASYVTACVCPWSNFWGFVCNFYGASAVNCEGRWLLKVGKPFLVVKRLRSPFKKLSFFGSVLMSEETKTGGVLVRPPDLSKRLGAFELCFALR